MGPGSRDGDTGQMQDNGAVNPQTMTEPPWHRDLLAREPILDRPERIWDEASFIAEIAPDFQEIGASGARYDREEIKGATQQRRARRPSGPLRAVSPSAVTGSRPGAILRVVLH